MHLGQTIGSVILTLLSLTVLPIPVMQVLDLPKAP